MHSRNGGQQTGECCALVRARTALGAFPIRGAHSVLEVERAIEHRRGRPIRILEVPGLARRELCGLWLAGEDADFILHAPSPSRLHRQQFILHELGHIFLAQATVDDGWPDAVPEVGGRLLWARDRMPSAEEVAAEMLADLLAAQIRHEARPAPFLRVFG